MSQLKIKDSNDQWINIPASGIGVPSGGTTGQVLQKSSDTDYATEWTTIENPNKTIDISEDVTLTKDSGNATVSLSSAYRSGNIIALRFSIKNGSSAISAGTTAWLGTVNINGVELANAQAGYAYSGGTIVIVSLQANGSLTVRPMNGQLAADAGVSGGLLILAL